MDSIRGSLRRARSFVASQDGVSATEYAIMLALIVLVAAGTIHSIGDRMMNIYDNIDDAMPEGV